MSQEYQGGKRLTHDGPCPTCRSHGRDRTGNHLQFWENDKGEHWAFCNRCGHYEDDGNKLGSYEKKERRELTDEEVAEVIAEIAELPFQALGSRGITLAVAERYGVRVGLSPQDGQTQVSHFYPKMKGKDITGYKVRQLNPKFFYHQGRGGGCDLFGMQQAMLKDVFKHSLYIFEDELSTMSGFQVLKQFAKEGYKNYSPACVGLPDGTKSAARVCGQNKEFFMSFKEIVVCMDNDKAGDEAMEVIRSLFPDKVKVVRLPLKDANDMLMAGREMELYQHLRFNAKAETPDGAVSIMDCLEDALKKPEWGLSFPWQGLTNLTYGIQFGEIIAVGGGVGLGKTLIGHELCAHLINVEHQRIGMFMLEETVGNTIKNISGKVANIPFHRPDVEYDPQTLRDVAMSFGDNVALWQNKGQNSWENIKACMRFWAVVEGRRIMILDNITALTAHLTPSEINTEISKIASELAGLCDELGIACFVFSHLNPPSGGKPHEEGGEVKEVQFTGSRALMRWCQVILGFERNKYAEGDAKNISRIKLLKDRKYGQSGYIHTRFFPETGRLLEVTEQEAGEYEQTEEDKDRSF